MCCAGHGGCKIYTATVTKHDSLACWLGACELTSAAFGVAAEAGVAIPPVLLALSDCAIVSRTLPPGLTSIGSYLALTGCSRSHTMSAAFCSLHCETAAQYACRKSVRSAVLAVLELTSTSVACQEHDKQMRRHRSCPALLLTGTSAAR